MANKDQGCKQNKGLLASKNYFFNDTARYSYVQSVLQLNTTFYLEKRRSSIWGVLIYRRKKRVYEHYTRLYQLCASDSVGVRCFLEQETLPVLLSTGWVQEWIRAWFHNRTTINWGPYWRLTLMSNKPLVNYRQIPYKVARISRMIKLNQSQTKTNFNKHFFLNCHI